ncbi:MAG: SIMPL domain-containing protein [Chloroflexota bacterium]
MRYARSALAVLLAVGLTSWLTWGSAAAADSPESTVSVVGDGRVIVHPDVAMVGLGVEATAPTVAAAQADAATRMQAVVDTLLAQGVVRDDITTTRVSINPVYDQRDNSIIRGQRVSNMVQAKMRDLDRVGPIIDAATAAGANRVEGVSFGVENLKAPKDQARALAMADARAKADQLAGLAGVRVIGVRAIAESDASSVPVRADRVLAAPAPGGASTPVEPGTQEIRTQVSVVFIIQ